MDTIARGMASSAKTVTDDAILYNAQAGLLGWRIAKARLDNGVSEIINLNVISDSIGEGKNDVNIASPTVANYLTGYVDIIRTALAAKYGNVGEGWVGNQYPIAVPAASKRWTYTGDFVFNSGYGWMYSDNAFAKLPSSKTGTATIVFDGGINGGAGCTGFKLTCLSGSGYAGAMVTVTTDGGAPEAWTIANDNPKNISTFTKTGLEAGSHTAVVSATTDASHTFELFGGYETMGTKGVRVNKLCVSGGKSQMVADYNSYVPGYLHTNTCCDYWTPKLAIITFLPNEYNSNVPPETFRAEMQTIITKCLLTASSIMLTSIGGIWASKAVTSTYPFPAYRQIIKELAIANNVAYLDITKRWGVTDTRLLAAQNDEVHPSIYGHQDIANCILKALEVV